MTPKDIIKVLEARGFLLKRINGSHHIFQHPDSKKVTVVPCIRKTYRKEHFMPFLSNSVLKGMILDEPLTPDFIYSFGVPPAFKCSMDKFVQHFFGQLFWNIPGRDADNISIVVRPG